VLVVDDSVFMRKTIAGMIARMPGMEVVGFAEDGIEAVQRVLECRPDVITMDVEMPRMDGVAAVAEIMRTLPTPVVMLSTLTQEGAETTLRALDAGAVDFVAKPGSLSHQVAAVAPELAKALQGARGARVRRRLALAPVPGSPRGLVIGNTGAPARSVVVIGSSTGGPPALSAVVPRLPAGLDAGVLVVQHMPSSFTAALARRLDGISALHVTEATDGQTVAKGEVLVAPGDYHLEVRPDRRVHIHQAPALHGVRPSVDVTLDSVARVYGRRAVVAILTGMGVDGADGAAKVEQAGGRVIVQDEATSVIYGMPRVTKERTRAAVEAPLERVADTIVQCMKVGRSL
jgi:two-component system chemotaxis response regulator CheB